MLHRTGLIAFLLMAPLALPAQCIDNTLSYKNISAPRYLRVNYENDFFSGTDKYYTQGIHLEWVAPAVRQFPVTRLLLHPAGWFTRYGLGAEHDGYTPSSISNPAILYGDRPFAASLFLKTFCSSVDPLHRQRWSAALSTGIIGQAAGGMEMQTGIHRWLHDITPHGWPNQIHNDAIVNYEAGYEKQLLQFGHFFSLDADAMARAGTLSDKTTLGCSLQAGLFDAPFLITSASKKRLRIYAYEHAEAGLIGYDATLQGGVFNHSSPYTIAASDIERITFSNRFGFVLSYQRIWLEYFQSFLSPEFKTGEYHVWGGIQIAFGI